MPEINTRLKSIRKELGINQKQIAEQLGIRQSYYSDIENGKRNVSKKVIDGLVKKFNISQEYIFKGTGNTFAKKNIGENVSIVNESGINEPKSLNLYNYYKTLSESDLDYKLSTEIEKVREIFEDYKKLTEVLHELKPPDRLIKKFPKVSDFKDYWLKIGEEFDFLHSHVKNEKRLKALKIIDLCESEIEHWRNALSQLISFMHRYTELHLLTEQYRR